MAYFALFTVCPDGFVQNLDRCYYSDIARKQADAKSFCETLKPLPGTSDMETARLVEPHGPFENAFVSFFTR